MNETKNNKRRKAKELIKQVSGKVKILRNKMKLTQEELEGKSGLTISRCESGKYDMTLTTVSILSKHLEVHPYELLK